MTHTNILSRDATPDVSAPKPISITFKTNQADMTTYPRAQVVQELTTRISECADHLCGEYTVIVGDVSDLPATFFWKPYGPGTRGRGFYLGPVTEDGITYPGRCYTLQSPGIAELSEAIDAAVDRVVVPPKKAGPKRFPVVLASEPNPHTRFLTGFAELLALARSNTIAVKDTEKDSLFSELIRLSYGCIDDIAQKAQLQSLIAEELLRQVPSTKNWLKLYSFGQGAHALLPKQLKGLVGISLMPPQSPPTEVLPVAQATDNAATSDASTPSSDLQDRAALFVKAQSYKKQAEAAALRANTAEAALQAEQLISTSLRAQIKNFDQQVEAQARAMLDKMIKDL